MRETIKRETITRVDWILYQKKMGARVRGFCLFFVLLLCFVQSDEELPQAPGSFHHKLTILSTNDLHSSADGCCGPDAFPSLKLGTYARISSMMSSLRSSLESQGSSVIAVDAGDWYSGTLFDLLSPSPVEVSSSVPEMEFFHYNKYDAICFGNHDMHDAGEEGMLQILQKASDLNLDVTIVSSDMKMDENSGFRRHWKPKCSTSDSSDCSGLKLVPYKTKTFPIKYNCDEKEEGSDLCREAEFKVGIMGVMGTDSAFASAPERKTTHFSGYDSTNAKLDWTSLENQVKSTVKLLREEKCHFVICLIHGGLPEDIDLAKAVPGIDMIVSGHTHETYTAAVLRQYYWNSYNAYSATYITQCSSLGAAIGVATFDIEFEIPVDYTNEPRELVLLGIQLQPLSNLPLNIPYKIDRPSSTPIARASRIQSDPHPSSEPEGLWDSHVPLARLEKHRYNPFLRNFIIGYPWDFDLSYVQIIQAEKPSCISITPDIQPEPIIDSKTSEWKKEIGKVMPLHAYDEIVLEAVVRLSSKMDEYKQKNGANTCSAESTADSVFHSSDLAGIYSWDDVFSSVAPENQVANISKEDYLGLQTRVSVTIASLMHDALKTFKFKPKWPIESTNNSPNQTNVYLHCPDCVRPDSIVAIRLPAHDKLTSEQLEKIFPLSHSIRKSHLRAMCPHADDCGLLRLQFSDIYRILPVSAHYPLCTFFLDKLYLSVIVDTVEILNALVSELLGVSFSSNMKYSLNKYGVPFLNRVNDLTIDDLPYSQVSDLVQVTTHGYAAPYLWNMNGLSQGLLPKTLAVNPTGERYLEMQECMDVMADIPNEPLLLMKYLQHLSQNDAKCTDEK